MIIDNNKQVTAAKSILTVNENDNLFTVDEIMIVNSGQVGFKSRKESDVPLTANIGSIKANKHGTLDITNRVSVFLQTKTQTPPVDMILSFRIKIHFGGRLDMPEKVYIQNDGLLEWCGGLSGTKDIHLKHNGTLKSAYPAYTGNAIEQKGKINLNTIIVDHGGHLLGHTECTASPQNKLNLNLLHLNTTVSFKLDKKYFNILSGDIHHVNPTNPPYSNETCLKTEILEIGNGQFCYLEAEDYSYTTVIIKTGGEIRLKGDPEGEQKTKLKTETLIIYPGAKIDGTGAGFESNGPGQGQKAGQGGSHGGLCASCPETATSYGQITAPTEYGSNSASGKTGGGQIDIEVFDYFNLEGEVDVSGEVGGGGSGGSIWIKAGRFVGDGVLKADGASGGGGGGRIAVRVDDAVNKFTGLFSAAGGVQGNQQGSSGEI